MWDKLGKIALQAGKIYVEKRGVDGVIEDANKVFNAAKKGAQTVGNMFSSEINEQDINEEEFEKTLNYEYLDDYITNILSEMKVILKESRNFDVLSKEFYMNIKTALDMGYNAMASLLELEDEVSEQDYFILLENYIAPIDAECDKLIEFIGKKCKKARTTPVSKEKCSKHFTMEVHGVFPINCYHSNTYLVGEIKTGKINKGDIIILDKENNLSGKVAWITMFGTNVDSADAGDICAISVLGDYVDELPTDVFEIGNDIKEVTNFKENETSQNEIEYIDELKVCLADDGEISEKERRLLNKLRITLGISEERAKELEAECTPNVLSPEEEEYAEEVKVVLEDGVISDKERRLLDKLRKSLGISEERAKEIENNIKVG